MEAYENEKLDRNVLWLLKKIPEIESPKCDISIEDRLIISFNLNKTGFVMSLLMMELRKSINDKLNDFITTFDEQYGRLPVLELKLQEQIKKFLNISDFNTYYQLMTMKNRNNDEINSMLLQAIKNSKDKGYHGDNDIVNKLPDSNIQFEKTECLFDSFKLLNLDFNNLKENDYKELLIKRHPQIE